MNYEHVYFSPFDSNRPTCQVIFGGYPDETLSARCYREKRLLRYVVDVLFFLQRQDGKGHCEQCYEYEQKRKDMPDEYRTIKVKT